MYLAFAPSILVQCSVAVLAFAEMLSINVPLALVDDVDDAVRLHRRRPHAEADVPGVVAHPVAPRRRRHRRRREHQRRARREVVRGGGRSSSQHLTGAAMRAEWANVKDADIRAKWSPLLENLPRLGQAIVLFYGGYLAINGQATVGDIVAFNAYVLMLQPPFRQLGMILMMGQRASASAQRIYEVLDEQPDVVDRPGAVDLVECRGDVHFDDVSFEYAERHAGARRLRPPPAPGRDRRARRAHRQREVDRGPPARALLRRHRAARCASTATTCATSRCRACATTSAWCSTSRSSSRCRSATTSRTGVPTRPFEEIAGRGARGRAPTSSSRRSPRATTPSSASAASRSRAVSASASPSPARWS